jgi:hypothetical protein
MDWNRPMDVYCERLAPGLLAEPLNAASNLAFFVAAWLLLRRVRGREWDFQVLIGLLALIGIGSLTFHTVATLWAAIADTLAIAIFIWFYLQRLLVRFGHLNNVLATLAIVVYAVGSRIVEKSFPEGALNGSASYLPALATLLVITAWVGVALRPARRPFILASLIFLGSLALRTIDQAACPAFPLGTHFLWHLLNATVLYSLCLGLAGLASPTARSRSNA